MTANSQNIVSRYEQRRVLLFSLAVLGALFAVTAALARGYHAQQERLATDWYQEGQVDFAGGRLDRAFEDFRNSLSYSSEDPNVQLQLAEALLAAGRFNEARSYLVNLWDRTPGAGRLNLDLARVSVQLGEVDDAIRYFHGAIFGSWEKEPAAARRNVRLELCEFLLARGRATDARAEIAGLAADTPAENGALHQENGRLFLKVGESGRALAEFEAALRINPQQSQWLAEAGQVAFDDGDYLKAETYFAKADRENPSAEIHASLALVRDVLGNDPYLAGLSDEEQALRTWRDFQQGAARLRQCAGSGTPDSLSRQSSSSWRQLDKDARELQKRVNLSRLARNPELRAETMQFVSRIEAAASSRCGPPASLDRALELIAKRHEGSIP